MNDKLKIGGRVIFGIDIASVVSMNSIEKQKKKS